MKDIHVHVCECVCALDLKYPNHVMWTHRIIYISSGAKTFCESKSGVKEKVLLHSIDGLQPPLHRCAYSISNKIHYWFSYTFISTLLPLQFHFASRVFRCRFTCSPTFRTIMMRTHSFSQLKVVSTEMIETQNSVFCCQLIIMNIMDWTLGINRSNMISMGINFVLLWIENESEQNGNTLSPLARLIARNGLNTRNTRSVLIDPIVLPPLYGANEKR